MEKRLSAPIGQILYSSIIFSIAFVGLHFSQLNMIQVFVLIVESQAYYHQN